MRSQAVLFALGCFACSVGNANAADVGFSDKICPEATQYVLAAGKLRRDDPPQTVYQAAQAAVDAYARCSKDKLTNGFREAQHYADTRGGGFAVVAARALIALGRADEARADLKARRVLVQQVVDWQSETVTPAQGHSPNTADAPRPGERPAGGEGYAIQGDHRPSMYRAAAKDVVASIDAELARIDGLPRESRPQAPQAAATPAH